ncbi:MAG: 30S ribosomal protein S4 [Candidatus Niyogibacteria bacterium]|nr:30S ribosomal protein S4 [Candidatus Niyogibacteria bacterium]
MDVKCKICRRAGEKLFLKGERCFSPKCALTRKPYAPGMHGKKRGKRLSEFGAQLKEKQKMREMYGLREKQFRNYAESAIRQKTHSGKKLIELLESRLDSVFSRAFAMPRKASRQIVSHGHVLVNGRKVNVSSYSVKAGDVVKIRPQSENKGVFANLDTVLQKYNPPAWLSLDKSKKECKVLNRPVDEPDLGINVNSIIEYYSR